MYISRGKILIELVYLQEGKPIIELPPKHVELVRLEFSDDERQVRQYVCLHMDILHKPIPHHFPAVYAMD